MAIKACKHCGCELGIWAETDECNNVIWCALIAARKPDATEDEQLLADAVAALSSLGDARRARTDGDDADADADSADDSADAGLTGRDLFSREALSSSALW
jgi:hypothetical protein